MIGQKNLLKQFNSFDNLFSSMILFGPRGSGKKTLLKEISNSIGCDLIEISSVLNDELKDKLYNNQNNTIVYFDLTRDIQLKQLSTIQNSALKFIEELPSNYKLFILAENESFLLDTILNRCYKQTIDRYSIDELKLIATDNNNLKEYPEDKFRYFNYPAEILNAPKLLELEAIEKVIETIFSSIAKANISNILSISKKIDINRDLDLFFNIFNYKLTNKLKFEYSPVYFDIFKLFNEVNIKIHQKNINKTYLFEKFLLELKQITACYL